MSADEHGGTAHVPLSKVLNAIRNPALHTALGEKYDSASGIYQEFLDFVFVDERFVQWESGDKNFELRCSGTPGCGKTTLSALVVERLREKYAQDREAVAAIFIQYDIVSNETSFIEDFLVCVLRQLSAKHTCSGANCALHQDVLRYARSCRVGQRTVNRIRLARQALETCIASLAQSFLVLDGFDRCNPAVELFLEDEFPRLRAKGLKIMTTSRIPCLREPVKESYYDCDGENCENPENRKICWVCQGCVKESYSFVLCLSCKNAGQLCKTCGDASNFAQPYDHVDFNISLTSGGSMSDFIAWSLETEHGDLGLDSGVMSKPPPSRLAIDIRQSARDTEAQELVERIAGRAEENVTLALARLELIYDLNTVEATKAVGDRLPSSITTLFNAGIQAIESQPRDQRDLGLKAIAAVAHAGSHGMRGLKFADLDRWLREAASLTSRVDVHYVAHRSLEEVLRATKGYLVATVPPEEVERFVEAYHGDFLEYAAGGYNESIKAAAGQLHFDKLLQLGKIERSKTVQFDMAGSPSIEQDSKFAELNKAPIVTVKRIGTGHFEFDDTRAFQLSRRETGWA